MVSVAIHLGQTPIQERWRHQTGAEKSPGKEVREAERPMEAAEASAGESLLMRAGLSRRPG